MKTARKLSTIAAFAASAGLAAATPTLSANTAEVTTAVGNGANTYLINDTGPNAGAPQGSAAELELRNYSGVRMRMPLLRFDLSAYEGDTITGASLSITAANINRDRVVAVYGFTNYAYNNASSSQSYNWSAANTLYPGSAALVGAASTGSYAPGFSASSAGTYSPALSNGSNPVNGVSSAASSNWSLLGGFETGLNGTPVAAGKVLTSSSVVNPTVGVPGVSTTSTSFADFLNAALADRADKGLVTIALMTTNSDSSQDFYFYSSNNTSGDPAPTLNLTFTPAATPEPASLGLLGLALGGLLLLHRRKATR
jgi:hypothetical protein